MSKLIGTQAFGLRIPFIKEGDDIIEAIIDSYVATGVRNGDVVGVTESVVARSAGMYVGNEEVGKWIDNYIEENKPEATHLVLYSPIFSRNRFLPILRGMLISGKIKKVTVISRDMDEVGNFIQHQITGCNYKNIYREWIEGSGKEFHWVYDSLIDVQAYTGDQPNMLRVDCRLHAKNKLFNDITLQDILHERNSWGLLGMNSAGNNRLKLFPDKQYAEYFVNTLKQTIKAKTDKEVEVMIYGDGAYKDPMSGIWEWADPVVSPAWTAGLGGFPTEMKLKNAIDSGMTDQDIRKSIKSNRENSGQQLGTTPRRIVDLLGSLMDLVSGSGDKGTPVVIVRDYFKKYID